MAHLYKVPISVITDDEGGYTVTSPALPELLTEGDTIEHALENLKDALQAVVELYRDLGKGLPAGILLPEGREPVSVEYLVAAE